VELLKAELNPDATRIKAQELVRANDLKMVERLKSLGFAVTAVDEHPTGDVLAGVSLIVISDSVNTKQIQAKYKNVALPVVTWASDLYGAMGLTGKIAGEDYGTTGSGTKPPNGDRFAWMVNGPSPLSAGLATNVIQDLYDDNEFVTSWGKPSFGAINIAFIPGYPDKRTIFAYEKGATMDGGLLAPSRRVGFYLRTQDVEHMRPTGLKLFDAAVWWAVSPPDAP
ncbi:MAG: rane protein, partial [Verrucomicrobia bacterium]|nr:rane protein [Verrucomicrobiota bacterium]